MNRLGSFNKLDNLISVLEAEILKATDRNILSTKDARDIEKKVATIINSRRVAHEEEPAATIPSDAVDRRRLFETIIGARSRLPLEIRTAFRADSKISDEEVSILLNKFLRLGLLTKGKKD